MSNFNLYAFYKFVELKDYEELKPHFLCLMKKYRVYGTIVLAHEGLNGTVCAQPENIAAFWSAFTKDERWTDMRHTVTYSDSQAFGRMKVKIRQEIVTMGIPGVKANQHDETHVNGNTWNEIIANPDTLVIDTRNAYEFELGSFKHAINPQTDCFRDFPAYVERELMAHKDKPIAMFCTGGVRCEKSTQYLKNLGFNEVYQLDGGIITYLQNMPEENSLWEGECFVFDDRITVLKQDCQSN